ncbi:hypothetical protein DSO57_1020525 [Entomophthora muscae]|uniref:Uncharacterized protein n=1 Tax=Entomophthora muscae TaxID=34485 RepID=A0ACC2S5W6_9FUNG|nr:hypothetical protein DSO57_1020525 [Entomophthora muscae]
MNIWFSQKNYSDPVLPAYHLSEADAKLPKLLQIPVISYGPAYPSEYSPKLAYSLHMTLPVTPQPSHLKEQETTADTISTQLFGVLYITLTGLVNSMVPANRPWALLGKLFPYIVKLALIL